APGAKVITKPVSVASLFHIIHLLKDGGVKLVQHSFPVSVLISFRKETIGQLYKAKENRHVEGNSRLEIRTLNFDGNFLTCAEPCAVDLSERRGRNWCVVNLDVALVKTTT